MRPSTVVWPSALDARPRPFALTLGLRHFTPHDADCNILASVPQARVLPRGRRYRGTISHLSFRRADSPLRKETPPTLFYAMCTCSSTYLSHRCRDEWAPCSVHRTRTASTPIYEIDQDNQQTPGRPQCESARRLLRLATRTATGSKRVTEASDRLARLFRKVQSTISLCCARIC